MTVICIRDGIMAVDSVAYLCEMRVGDVVKWRAVSPDFGGGFIAGAGDFPIVCSAMDRVSIGEDPGNLKDGSLLWLKADRTVIVMEDGGQYALSAPFVARGVGREFALGAMVMGASAEQAARLACDNMAYCGGPVHVLRLT